MDAADRPGGHVDLTLDWPGGITEERHFQLLAGLAAGRRDGGGPRKRADVQPIPRFLVARVRRLPNLHDVAAVRGCDQREDAVLERGGRVIGGRELKPFRIDDRDEGIEAVATQPQAFGLDRQPLPLLEFDGEAVEVFGFGDPVHRRVERHRLRLLQRAVRLDLIRDRQCTDPKRAIFGDP